MTTDYARATMWDVKDPARAAALKKKARAFRRAKETLEATRLALRQEILEAAEEGERPADIMRAIDREYDAAHVSRMIHGKA